MIKPWKVLKSTEIFKTSFFRFRRDQCELPDGRVMPNYFVMEFPDWVNVIALTDDGKVILVEQYRHAYGKNFLEIPGGSTNPSDGDEKEDPKKAALRELQEETGYVPDDIRLVSVHAPNPAMQNNRVHTYLATGCKKVAEPDLDPFEDLQTIVMPLNEVIEKIMSGEINHSIVVAAFMCALPTLGFHLPQARRG